jgi:hypothetical protein
MEVQTMSKLKLFQIKTYRKRPGIAKCLTKNSIQDILLTPKVSQASYVLTIAIEPVVVAINRLPFPIILVSGSSQKQLAVNVPFGLSNVRASATFRGGISIPHVTQPVTMVSISTDTDATTEIPIGHDLLIACDAQRKHEFAQIQLIFYAPVILFNKSSQLLYVSTGPKDRVLEFARRTADANQNDDGILVLGKRSYFSAAPSLPIQLLVPADPHDLQSCSWSEPIECISLDTHNVFLIPHPAMRETFIPLHFTIQSVQPYARSIVVTVFSQFSVTNQLPYPITIQPLRGKYKGIAIGLQVRIRSGETAPILSVSREMCFGFWSDISPHIIPLEFVNHVRRTFVVKSFTDEPVFVEYCLEERGLDKAVTFKKAELPQPIMITNLFEEDIAYSQHPSEYRVVVPALSTRIFAWEKPAVLTFITLHLFGRQIGIGADLAKEKVEMLGDRMVYIFFELTKEQSQSVVVSPDPPVRVPRMNFRLKVDIPNITISLIDDKVREFLLFSLHNIQTSFWSNEYLNSLTIFVHSVQLDDLHPQAYYRVPVIGDPCGNFHFLEFRCSTYANCAPFSKFRDISFRMQQLLFYLDIRFLSDFLNFIHPHVSGTGEIAPPDTSLSQSPLADLPVSVDSLIFYAASILVCSRTSTGRPNSAPLFYPKMRFLPNITGWALNIPEKICRDLASINAMSLQKEITDGYMAAIREQLWKVIGNIDLLGRKSMTNTTVRQEMAAGVEETGFSAVPRRIARAMPRRQVLRFDHLLSIWQSLIQGDRNSKKLYPGETIELWVRHKESNRGFCLTQRYLFEIFNQRPGRLLELGRIEKIKKIAGAKLVGNDVVLKTTPDEMVIPCPDFPTAEQIKIYILSRIFALNFGS